MDVKKSEITLISTHVNWNFPVICFTKNSTRETAFKASEKKTMFSTAKLKAKANKVHYCTWKGFFYRLKKTKKVPVKKCERKIIKKW